MFNQHVPFLKRTITHITSKLAQRVQPKHFLLHLQLSLALLGAGVNLEAKQVCLVDGLAVLKQVLTLREDDVAGHALDLGGPELLQVEQEPGPVVEHNLALPALPVVAEGGEGHLVSHSHLLLHVNKHRLHRLHLDEVADHGRVLLVFDAAGVDLLLLLGSDTHRRGCTQKTLFGLETCVLPVYVDAARCVVLVHLDGREVDSAPVTPQHKKTWRSLSIKMLNFIQ